MINFLQQIYTNNFTEKTQGARSSQRFVREKPQTILRQAQDRPAQSAAFVSEVICVNSR